MGDEDDVSVVPETLRGEGQRWLDNSATMWTVFNDLTKLSLSRFAFYAGPDAPQVSSEVLFDSYEDLWRRHIDIVGQANIEFIELNRAMNRAADSYDSTELSAEELIRYVYVEER